MPSPTLINAVFLIFPICVITACITLFTWFDLLLNPFLPEVVDMLDTLREGSSIWDQLRISSTTEEKYQLVTNLTQVVSRTESHGQELNIHFRNIVNSTMILQWVILAFVCIAALVRMSDFPSKGNTAVGLWQDVLACGKITDHTEHENCSQVFLVVFCKLARRFHEQAHQSSTSSVSQSSPIHLQSLNNLGEPTSIIHQRSNHQKRTLMDTVRSNPQFGMFINPW
jgi:hypothetical protein